MSRPAASCTAVVSRTTSSSSLNTCTSHQDAAWRQVCRRCGCGGARGAVGGRWAGRRCRCERRAWRPANTERSRGAAVHPTKPQQAPAPPPQGRPRPRPPRRCCQRAAGPPRPPSRRPACRCQHPEGGVRCSQAPINAQGPMPGRGTASGGPSLRARTGRLGVGETLLDSGCTALNRCRITNSGPGDTTGCP